MVLTIEVKESIDVTPKEKPIFDRVLAVVNHFNLKTQIRVAGGWVRDKLLGEESDDIDFALDNIFGNEFADKLNEYALVIGEEISKVEHIKCNPNQSKHLATARMKLFGIQLDFVNLRDEEYSIDSRIPTMKFGTAKDDAFRRDLTINSLFYNISTNCVEDFTERGISDLKSGRIATPLPPKQTFLDDPLRVLRAIRFGTRFGFVLDEELKVAADDDDVRAAIEEKISRERIGDEIKRMVSGNQPSKAMMYVAEMELFWFIFFGLRNEFDPPPPDKSDGLCVNAFDPPLPEKCDRLCVSYMNSTWRLLEFMGVSLLTDDQRRLCLYAALFVPFRETVCSYKKKKKKKKEIKVDNVVSYIIEIKVVKVVCYIFRNSLKLKSSDADAVMNLHVAVRKFLTLLPFLILEHDVESIEVDWMEVTVNIPACSKLRVLTGLLLSDIEGFWRAALLLSVLLYPGDISCTESDLPELEKRKELFRRVEDRILKLGLEEVWKMTPLVDGNVIMNILGLKTGTPVVGEWTQKLIQWQLAHPSGTADAFIQTMKENCSNLKPLGQGHVCLGVTQKKKEKRKKKRKEKGKLFKTHEN